MDSKICVLSRTWGLPTGATLGVVSTVPSLAIAIPGKEVLRGRITPLEVWATSTVSAALDVFGVITVTTLAALGV